MKLKNIIILGTSGNSIDILDTINEINCNNKKYNCIGFLDDNKKVIGKYFLGKPVLGNLSSYSEFKECYFVNGICSPYKFWMKRFIIEELNIPINRFETIIHPTASVSKTAKLGNDTVIFQNVSITSNVRIGKHVMILPNSIISHDSIIGDYTTITGGVCISGNVKIGSSCYLGTNSCIKNNIIIEDNCLIGMGSVVLNNIKNNSVFVGNPAKFIRDSNKEFK